jgi:hypothetical protein
MSPFSKQSVIASAAVDDHVLLPACGMAPSWIRDRRRGGGSWRLAADRVSGWEWDLAGIEKTVAIEHIFE